MLWLKYLHHQLTQIIIFLIIFCLYIFTFWLWRLPWEALANSGMLVILFFGIYLLSSFFPWKREQIELEHIQKEKEELEHRIEEQERANKEFSDIIRIWSHQMKVPLSAIDLMSQTKISKNELKNQVFALENYLNILLEYQRITGLSTDFRFERVKMSNVTRELIKKYSSFFIQKDLSVNFEVEEEWEIATDLRWLSLALEQIINNAVKYTKTGGVTVKIKKGEILFQDTGIGILSEDLPRIFEHGFTGYNGRIQQKSTGLGLYLSKLIFDKLDFRIDIDSEIGQGTSVKIRPKKK